LFPNQDLIGRFTLDSASEFLFGSCLNTLAAGLPYPPVVALDVQFSPITSTSSSLLSPIKPATTIAQKFTNAFLGAQEAISNRERFSLIWPLLEIREDKTEEPMKVINAFIQPIVNEAIAKMNDEKELRKEKANAEELEEEETLLDHLVKQTDDPVVIKDATLNIMIAGRDTTASTLTFVSQ
jgi:cytochrome P450